MTSISATALRQNLYQTITQVNEESKPISITSSRGKGSLLVGEDDSTKKIADSVVKWKSALVSLTSRTSPKCS